MIDASRSIKACAAFYGDEADAMEAYLKAGEKKALELDNRGPIVFDEDGKLCSSIREAYSKYGFYVFENVIDDEELKDIEEDLKHLKIIDVLKKVISNPNVCSKEWIWQQYDHTVMGDTIQKPGGDSGVVRVHGTNKAVAASVDSSAVYCWAHPLTGGKQVVCESFRNLISVGAKPVAITNCLNFGSPENEENMGEFVECVQGIGEAAEYLKFPVVSGNVSFCLLYTSPSPRDKRQSRMPSSA